MRDMTLRLASLLIVAALVSLSFARLHAQETISEPEDGGASAKTSRLTQLKKIVIGAGAEKVALDTPQSVSVLEQDDLDGQQADNIGDVLASIPGVHAAGSESMLGQTINIRGIGAPETSSDQNRIIINVDGVGKFYESYRMGSFFTDPELFKRVEVLRGPASSTLYGSGALGGIVNFTTKDASDFLGGDQAWGGRLKESWTSNGNGLLGSVILAARPSETMDFLAAGNARRQGNYRAGDGAGIGGNELFASSFLVKSTFRFGEGNEQALKLSWQDWSSFTNDQNYVQTSSIDSFGTVDRLVRDRTFTAAYENEASDNDWLDLKSQLSWSNITNEQRDARMLGGEPWDTSAIPMFQDTVYGYETWSWNLSNTIDASGENFENHLTVGTQLSHQTRSVLAERQLSYHPGGVDARAGFYIQNEFVYDDRLTLIPGYRIDVRQLTPDESLAGLQSAQETASSPKIAALYKVTDSLGLFGSLAHTERLASLDEVYSAWYPDYPVDMTPAYGADLRKERAFTREAGFTLSGDGVVTEDDSVALKTTFFRNDIRDLIQRLDIGPNSGFSNVGRARIDGVEIELSYDAERVFAQAGYALVRGYDLTGGGYLNTVAPDEFSFTLGGRLVDHGVSFGWRGRLVAEQERVATGATARFPTPGFDVHNIFLNWKPAEGGLEGLSAQLAVDNIFDRHYREYLANDYAYGRTFKISLIQSF